MRTLKLEKETLRNLSGPAARLHDGLEDLATPQLQAVQGGKHVVVADRSQMLRVVSTCGSAGGSLLDTQKTWSGSH